MSQHQPRIRRAALMTQPPPATLSRAAPGTAPSSPARALHSFGQIALTSPAVPAVQFKLTVNTPGDTYEREADATADQVMRMSLPSGSAQLQRDDDAEDNGPDDDGPGDVQRKPLPSAVLPQIQRCACEDEAQRKEVDGELATTDVSSVVSAGLASGGRPLDPETRAFMEPRFGHDFSKVRIHDNAQASASAQSVSARAYTVGSNIAFRSQEFAPGSGKGRRLLAHELTHVVQQGQAAPLALSVQRSLWVSQMTSPNVQRDDSDDLGNAATSPEAPSSTNLPAPNMDPFTPNMPADPNALSSSAALQLPAAGPQQNDSSQQNDNDGGSAPVLLAGAALMPRDPNGSKDCSDLVEKMLDFVKGRNGIKTGLIERFEEMMKDAKDLYNKRRFKSDPEVGSRLGSWEGHQEEYEGLRNGLNKRIKNYNDNDCDKRGGPPIPAEVLEWAQKPAPVQPASAAAPQPANTPPAPRTATESPGVSWSKVIEVLAILGLSAALAVGVIGALLDPEPLSKLGAIGLDAVMAAKLMQMLGMAPAI